MRALPYTSPEDIQKSGRIMTAAMLALLGLGVVMAYSATMVEQMRTSGPGTLLHPLAFHLLKVGLALGGFLMAMRVGPSRLFASARPAWAAGVILLVLIPFLGTESHNARRWFGAGGLSFQPSEFARVATMVMVGAWMAAARDRVNELCFGVLVPFALAALPACLVFMEPDFGSAVYLLFMGVLVMWVGGARSRHLLVTFLPTLMIGSVLGWVLFSHFRARIMGFVHTEPDWQVAQGLTSLGSGGVLGAGLGDGMGKWGFLPEARNDFLFAVIGEELGLLGTVTVVALYALFLWHGTKVLLGLKSRFSLVVGAGLLMQVLVQAVLNIAVVTAVAPNKGLPLPFVSAGGTSLFVLCASAGLLLGLARRPEEDPVLEGALGDVADAPRRPRKLMRAANDGVMRESRS